MSAGPSEEAGLKGRAVPSRAALRTHTEWSEGKSAPRGYSAAGVSTQQTRHSVRRRRCSEGLGFADCGLRPVAAASGTEAAAAADGVAISDCAGMQ
jgi:hypothetical protein